MKIRCLYHHVLVKVDLPEQELASGIILPDSVADDKSRHTGVIEALGHGILQKDGNLLPLQVKKGDKVLFGKYAGLRLIINKVEYKHMREDEIIGIIEESEGPLDIEDDEY